METPPKSKMKLIRDLIPDGMHKRGYEPKLTILSPAGRVVWLLEKLVEESGEAKNDGGSTEELADVYECLRSLAEANGVTIEDIVARADAKAAKYGRFDKGYLWVNADDDSPLAKVASISYKAEREG